MDLIVKVAENMIGAVIRVLADAKIAADVSIADVVQTELEQSSVNVDPAVQALMARIGESAADIPPVRNRATGADTSTPKPRAPRTGGGRAVLYTPVGTARQIAKTMKELSGLDLLIYSDLAKHPASRNRAVRERLLKAKKVRLADESGDKPSVESVDNVIWQMTKRGIVGKRLAESSK